MSQDRDEHDPIQLTGIGKAIDDCAAAIVTELDDGKHEDLRASIRLLIDISRRALRQNASVATIAHNVATQDNAITELPIFVVQQRRRTYGIDDNYASEFVWMSEGDEPHEADAETAAKLDELRNTSDYDEIILGEDGEETMWTRVGYRDHWEFVTACFTRVGCDDYLRANGHNLKDPRIYVASGYRNQEWEAMRKHLLEMVKP